MVVACRKSGKGCTPAIYSGHVTGFGRDNSGGSKSSLIVGQEVDPGDVLGSPVLDANGLVIAVVVPPDPIGSPAPPGKRFLAVQLLVDMLRLAAVE